MTPDAATLEQVRFEAGREGKYRAMSFLLWLVAAILVIVGIVQLLQGQIIFGVLLIIAGCLVGPGGYSIFRSRNA